MGEKKLTYSMAWRVIWPFCTLGMSKFQMDWNIPDQPADHHCLWIYMYQRSTSLAQEFYVILSTTSYNDPSATRYTALPLPGRLSTTAASLCSALNCLFE